MDLAQLLVRPPLAPMLAKLAREIPAGDGWIFEPKWDGFRCIVFRDGEELVMTSRRSRPFDRYFPELRGPLAVAMPERAVIDGEIVVPDPTHGGLDFDALSQRIHPADSRVAALAASTPAAFVAFDLLALDDRSLLDEPFRERRRLLVDHLEPNDTVHLTPASADPDVARRWFTTFEGAGLDGVIAKSATGIYTPDRRTLVKVKHERTADCVVAGYRSHKDGAGVGSLLLGLFDTEGRLHHVGVTASFTAARRAELRDELAPLALDALDTHPWRDWADAADSSAGASGRLPGGVSRWNAGKDLSWVPLRVERVAEVTFGQLESGRFRHGSRFVRWRPDREPADCRYDQLEVANPVEFAAFLADPTAVSEPPD
ncbi:MAG: ATP-dependent DNA ligase [Ilumatobacteraceae bacterium]